MLQLTPQSRIFLAVQPVDFRKGIDGLAALCRQTLHENPLGRHGLCLSQPHRHDAQTLGLRWPRVLALYQTSVPRAFSLVADRHHTERDALRVGAQRFS